MRTDSLFRKNTENDLEKCMLIWNRIILYCHNRAYSENQGYSVQITRFSVALVPKKSYIELRVEVKLAFTSCAAKLINMDPHAH